MPLTIKRMFIWVFRKPINLEVFVNCTIPNYWCLFQAIYSFLQLQNLIFLPFYNIAYRLLNIKFFLKVRGVHGQVGSS